MAIVKKWDLKDRSDGVELRFRLKDGSTQKAHLYDEDARDLAETICHVQDSDDRPVTEGKHVR